MLENRQHERFSSKSFLRVYTNLSSAAYTVDIKDIGAKGAFVKSKFLPQVGEIVTFAIVDKYFKEVMRDSARVVWINDNGIESEIGFGIEFYSKLSKDLELSYH